MKVNYNASAIIANNALKTNDNKLSESLKKLSSGLKIPDAKENPSGLAIARRMNAQLAGLSVADSSTQDGISIVKTADGVMSEMHEILQRMNELAVKASNGTNKEDDRAVIQDEIAQLKEEIERIAQSTQFNGKNLLDGTYDLRGYATIGGATDPNVKVSTYSDDMPTGKMSVLGLSAGYDAAANQLSDVPATATIQYEDGTSETYDVESDGDIITLRREAEGKMVQIRAREELSGAAIDLDLTGEGAMSIQVGANEGQLLNMRIPTISLSNLGIYNMNVMTQTDATVAIDQIKGAISYISAARSRLGAYQNRLEHTDSNLDITTENMTSAYSQIMDVDMAEEMTTYSTQQVLSQAGISMLAQANERPSQVLQLLQ